MIAVYLLCKRLRTGGNSKAIGLNFFYACLRSRNKNAHFKIFDNDAIS